MSDISGKKMGYRPVCLEKLAEIYKGDGKELASMYQGGELSKLSEVTTDYETIKGHASTTMNDFL